MADEYITKQTTETTKSKTLVKRCDRCRSTSDELSCPIEAFNQLYVNPSTVIRGGITTESVKPGEEAEVKVPKSVTTVRAEMSAPKCVDLCPTCYKSWFGREVLDELRDILR